MAVRLKHRLALVAGLVMVLLFTAPAWASQVQVYVQNPDYNNLYASQNDTSGNAFNFTSYDNFTLASTTPLDLVYWAGGYYNPQSQSTITAWTISFYANNAGQPGALLSSFAIAGNANETFVQNDNLGDPVYFYNAAVNFTANAGTMYWLSVVPDLAFPPQWGWTSSSTGDGVSYTDDFFGNRIQNSSDLAFALYMQQQTTIPEPGTLMLLGSGLVGAASLLRRKFRV